VTLLSKLKFIALEGIDACGKNTQVRAVSHALWDMGYKSVIVDFPRYSLPVGSLIGRALKGEVTLTPAALHALMEVDRYDFADSIARLEKEGYDFIILDRWTLSNVAFASAKGLSTKWIKQLQQGLPKADLTILLDIPVKESFKRRPERRDLHEKDKVLLQRVRWQYTIAAANMSILEDELIFEVNGMQTPAQITEEILAHIKLSLLTPELADSEIGSFIEPSLHS
jgi:dTMP kinase